MGYELVPWRVAVFCCTLPKTDIATERWWLGNYFPSGVRPSFRGKLLVSWRLYMAIFILSQKTIKKHQQTIKKHQQPSNNHHQQPSNTIKNHQTTHQNHQKPTIQINRHWRHRAKALRTYGHQRQHSIRPGVSDVYRRRALGKHDVACCFNNKLNK